MQKTKNFIYLGLLPAIPLTAFLKTPRASSSFPPFHPSLSRSLHLLSICALSLTKIRSLAFIKAWKSPTAIYHLRERISMGATAADNERAIIFTYGTLKRGFSNHGLIQDMIIAGDAAFLGNALTADRFPLVCGPYGVPFLINKPGASERVSGELYAVSRRAIALIDELEGISYGHYERLSITVNLLIDVEEGDEAGLVVEAEAYFAHQSYGEEMWRRNGEKGLCGYSSEEAVGYVKRKDRPRDITFLAQIRIFVSSAMD